jgi:enoyl-CoA hydratase
LSADRSASLRAAFFPAVFRLEFSGGMKSDGGAIIIEERREAATDAIAAIIRFNRPEIRNPLSVEVLAELDRIFFSLTADARVKKIIFTGSGESFASGADLNEVSMLTPAAAGEFGGRGQKLLQKIYRCDKLTVAAVDGFCLGGALDLALSCRKRVASPRSVFGHPGARLGIMTGWGGTQLLPRLIGKKRAFEMFLTGRSVAADEALQFGLIDAVSENPLEFSLTL